MTVSLENIARNAACDAVVDLLDGGSVQFQDGTNADAVVATLSLSATAFGDAVAGTAEANDITADTDAVGGEITKAVFRNSADAAIFEVTVTETGGGGTITMSSTTIGAGDTVSLNSYSHTQPV